MVSKMARPGEYKRMFLPAHEVPVLHPYMVHPPREAPYPLHPSDERHVEFVRERERQVSIHTPVTDSQWSSPPSNLRWHAWAWTYNGPQEVQDIGTLL